MCGINGIISRDLNFPLLAKGERMNQLTFHRGPNDSGGVALGNNIVPIGYQGSVPKDETIPYLNFGSVSDVKQPKAWLGHQRLSILDLSPLGHCPMTDDSERYWITYNGEIYNFLELRKELEAEGVHFKTNGDTEVVLKAFIHWGEKCVDRFNGMWAFVIYDHKNQTVFGSRDRFGVKPFYYYQSDFLFAFSSEQKALVESGVVPKAINKKAVYDYLAFTQIEHQSESFFKDVIELEPGFSFTFSFHSWEFKKWQYYSLEYKRGVEEISDQKEREYIEEIGELFKSSIDLRLRSDVPVGTCLSGGIDSSAIIGQMHQLGSKDINAYTACSHVKELDESHYAKNVVDYVGAHWYQTTPKSNELLDDIEELVYCQDIPLFSTSTYAQWRVMKLVKDSGVKVVLVHSL